MNDELKQDYVNKMHDMFLVLQSINACYTTKEILLDWLKWRANEQDGCDDEKIKSIVDEFLDLLIKEKFVLECEEFPEDFDLDIELKNIDVIYKINKPLAYVNVFVKNGFISIKPENLGNDNFCEIEK